MKDRWELWRQASREAVEGEAGLLSEMARSHEAFDILAMKEEKILTF